jgi:hypothetical protein
MYDVDSLDTVVELADVPRPDIGAPLPLVVSDESNLILAYLVSEPDPDWDGSYTTVVSADSDDMAVALIRFRMAIAHMFGPPNDEAFEGHPLASRGLRPYAAFEIHQSSWIRRLERMNAVHPRHDPQRFMAGLRHFVFTFHDSTFECIAEWFESEAFRGSIRSAADRMIALLAERPP